MKYSYEQLSQQTALFLQLLSVERNLSNRTLNAYHSDLHCFMRWCRNSQVETLDQNTILRYFHYLQATLRQKASSIQRKYFYPAILSLYKPGGSFNRTLFPFLNQEIPAPQEPSPYPHNS